MRTTFNQKLLLLAFSISLLLIIDLMFSLFTPVDEFDKILNIIEPHNTRFWQNRQNFQGDFLNKKVEHDLDGFRVSSYLEKEPDIIVFGASSSYGWGLKSNETFSSIIESELGKTRPTKVINASNIGYSSYQGKLLAQQLLSNLSPKIIIITYLINDLDHFRFYDNSKNSDSQVKSSYLFNKTFHYLRKSSFFRFLAKTFSSQKNIGKGQVRVPLTEYHENMREIVKLALSKNIKVIILKMPFNIPTTIPKLLKNNSVNNLIRSSLTAEIKQRVTSYYQVIDEVSREFLVPIVNIDQSFGFNRDKFFSHPELDMIHPNQLGHQIIAREILKIISEIND